MPESIAAIALLVLKTKAWLLFLQSHCRVSSAT